MPQNMVQPMYYLAVHNKQNNCKPCNILIIITVNKETLYYLMGANNLEINCFILFCLHTIGKKMFPQMNLGVISLLHSPPFSGWASLASRKASNWQSNMLQCYIECIHHKVYSGCTICKVTGFEKKGSNH